MLRLRTFVVLVVLISSQCAFAMGTPDDIVRVSDEVLQEIVTIPGRQLPQQLLSEAHGVAIIPDVVKIGFIGGVRRGRGVVLVRDDGGTWSTPQFVVLTGGSIGWQVGVQATDVVLVFRTKKSIDGLLQGKFTLGADVAVAAGPVGRDAAAATDAQLKAEILSYSRSRGIFAGVSLDGSAIQVDHEAHFLYYGTPSTQPPARMPATATRLLEDLAVLAQTGHIVPSAPTAGTTTQPAPKVDVLRRALARNATAVYALVDGRWRQFLALPPEVFQEGAAHPSIDALRAAQRQFDQVAGNAQYRSLAERPEFQATRELLSEYIAALTPATQPQVSLPPPPPPASGPLLPTPN